ncbi:Mbeg1-like protein [uncultured Campylobacter sp.]|uniref:Mbeg1-like protein n=1 Tax=uncultured Campylobacter sp. TaxID=218934 RepID=UPI002622019E|nr:Mbeg1-like protein [uncultured Campylobacter sp.]
MQTKKSSKKLINCFKDYIDIADASYALLHNVFENEEGELDRLSKKHGLENLPENTINSCKKEEIDNPVWRYSDNIRLDDKITENNQTRQSRINNRRIGDPTAYALAIEARFMQDKKITKPDSKKDVTLDNDISNFIDFPVDENGQVVGDPYIFYKKEVHSPRTKLFVNRYELVKHIPNQKSGFSSTVFYDTAKSNYIIGFRGTEIKGNDFVDDFFMAITSRAIMQISALTSLQSSMVEAINSHSLNLNSVDGENESSLNLNQEQVSHGPKEVILSGHSLGGHLAQIYAVAFKDSGVKELYTYNAPGIYGGIIGSAFTWVVRFLSLIAKGIVRGVKYVARLVDPDGFLGKLVNSAFNKIKGMLGFKDDKSTVKECVNAVEKNDKACKTLSNKDTSLNIKRASKGDDLGIEIHHIESVKQRISKNEDSYTKDWHVMWEPTLSVISDLGFKLGVGMADEIEYKNTDNRHLINILVRSHSLKDSVMVLYLMCYLLEHKENARKIEGKDIASALDYINEYIQSLKFKLRCIRMKLNLDVDIDSISNTSMLDTPLYIFYAYLNLFYEQGKFSDDKFKQDMVGYIIENLGKNIDKNSDKEAHLVKLLDAEDIEKLNASQIVSSARAGDIDMLVAICALNLFVFDKKIEKDELGKYFAYNKNIYKSITTLCDNKVDIELATTYVKDRIEILKSIISLKYADYKKLEENENFLASVSSNEASSSDEAIVIAHKPSTLSNNDIARNNKLATEDIRALANESFGDIFHKKENALSVSAEDKSIIDAAVLNDIFKLDSKSMEQRVYLGSMLLNTATEQSDYPLYFKKEEDGEESNSNLLSFTHQPRDEEKDKGRLSVSYKNSQASILNYSLLNKSLNIDLKPTNKETKESLEKANERINLEKKSSALSAGGTAFANPIIEDDVVVCPHGGHVILKSRAGRSIRSDDQGVILDIDFINSPIVGCSAHNPCTKVAYVPRAALSIKSMNNHYAVMQDLVPACLSNTSSPLRCIKKENRIKLAHSIGSPTSENDNAAVLNPNLNKPVIRLHVKSALNQVDNLAVCIYKLNDVEHKNQEGFKEMELNLDEGGDVKDKKLKEHLSSRFREDKFSISSFNFKYSLMDKNFIFITPKYIEAIYKNTTLPKSGIGFFQFVDDISDESNLIYVTPSKAKTVDIKFACGLDSKYNDDINTTKTVVVA